MKAKQLAVTSEVEINEMLSIFLWQFYKFYSMMSISIITMVVCKILAVHQFTHQENFMKIIV